MLTKLLASTGLALFAMSGCEDLGLIADPPGETRVVYVNGEANHCIVVTADAGTPAPREDNAPAIAERQ